MRTVGTHLNASRVKTGKLTTRDNLGRFLALPNLHILFVGDCRNCSCRCFPFAFLLLTIAAVWQYCFSASSLNLFLGFFLSSCFVPQTRLNNCQLCMLCRLRSDKCNIISKCDGSRQVFGGFSLQNGQYSAYPMEPYWPISVATGCHLQRVHSH